MRGTAQQEPSLLAVEGRQQEQLLHDFLKELCFWGDLTEESHPVSQQQEPQREQQQLQQQQRGRRPHRMEHRRDSSGRTGKPVWRTAVDAGSGRTYYYDALTRRTQWDKPPEIREMERQRKRDKKQKDRLFFQEMEGNIRKSLHRGERIPGEVDDNVPQQQPEQPEQWRPTPQRVRTISGMDESLLAELTSRTYNTTATVPVSRNSHRDTENEPPPVAGRPPLPSRRTLQKHETLDLEFSPEEPRPDVKAEFAAQAHPLLLARAESSDQLRGEALLDGPIIEQHNDVPSHPDLHKQQQQHVRRNTGGTVYATSTMMNPDIDSTIKCVCGVYRAHIVQATHKLAEGSPVSVAQSFDKLENVFLDKEYSDHALSSGNHEDIPSLEEIVEFYKDFYKRSQMEHDTIIFSLIYVERLIKETNIAPIPANWRSVLFSCMVLASKVWDDLSMWNIDFSNVCGRGGGLVSFNLARINELELALLKCLAFNVKVPASEYARYYFLLRNTLLKSGLLSEETGNSNPGSPTRQAQKPVPMGGGHRGTRSMNDYTWMDQGKEASVSVEQLLSMTHY